MAELSVTIRKLEELDSFQVLTELLHLAYQDLMAAGLNYTAGYQDANTTQERCSKGTCFVAFDGEALIGTVLLQPSSADEDCETYRTPGTASIHQFAVHPDFRKTGIGKRLHEAALQEARAWGCSAIALDTATTAFELISLYKKWGYEIVEEVQWHGKTYRSYIFHMPI